MPTQEISQYDLIRQAVAQSLAARNRYVEQVVNDLTDELASAREQVGIAILRYKSLGSLPDNKLAGLKGLERLDGEIKSIMTGLKRTHTVRCRTEAKAAFRLGVYHGIEEFATAQLPVYRDLSTEGLDKLTTKAFQIVDTDALDFLANYTTTLAGDVNRETTDGIMRTIRGAIATGKGVDDIVRDLGEVVKDKESFRHAGTKVFSKAQYRMEVIARTEVLRAHNLGKLKFHQAVGIQRLEWFTMDDERVCPVCGPRDGQQYPIGEFPTQPAHPNCLLPGTQVIAPYLVAGTIRGFQGQVVTLRTASGNELSVTPNHPILTRRGWVAAGRLNEGDELVETIDGQHIAQTLQPDHQHVVTEIEQIVEFCLEDPRVLWGGMPIAAEDFHGDGIDQQVNIVWTYGDLPVGYVPMTPQQVRELVFGFRDGVGGRGPLFAFGQPNPLRGWHNASARRVMGSARQRQPFFLRQTLHPHAIRFAAIPDRDRGFGENALDCPAIHLPSARNRQDGHPSLIGFDDGGADELMDRLPCDKDGDAELAGEFLCAFPGHIRLTKLIEIRKRDGISHVYNLQTGLGWYIADNIITHNCRCGHNPAWPLVICGQGLLASSAAPNTGDACILPPQSIEGMAAAQAEEQKTLKAAFEGGDPAKLGALTMKQVQTLAKGHGVAIARTKADFLKLLADKGVDGSGLSGKSLEAMLKQYGIGALRSKDELVALLAQKQAAFVQAQIQAQLLKDAAKSATGLESMTVKDLQNLAVQKGISLNMTKSDVIALLDQLDPGGDHSGLSGQALIAAKKQFHIGPLKNKGQLIAALQQVAGKEMAQHAVQDVQQAAVTAATTALKDAAGKVVLPGTPGEFQPFLEQLAAAEHLLVNSPLAPPETIQQIATELSMKKLAFQQQVQSLGANDVKKIAQAAKISKYQWATKDELITLMTETSPAKLAPVKESIGAKWAKWDAAQKAKKTGIATAQAQQQAQHVSTAAVQQAKDVLEAKLDAVWTPNSAEGLDAYVTAMAEFKAAILSHGSVLSPEDLALYNGKANVLHGFGTHWLDDLKVSELKALAKAKKYPNWAFANKEQLVTLLSASDDAAKQDVLQALATKVAGYGKAAPKLKSGPALAAQLAQPDTPAAYLSTASYAHQDSQWATVVARSDDHFTFVRDARDLGGVHPKSIYRDPDGSEWLFKPMGKDSDAYIADADEMTYRISRLVDPQAIEVRKVTLGGQVGTIQRMKTAVKAPKDFNGINVAAMTQEELAQLQQHHVLDWLLSNHDAHGANFLRLQDGSVVAIDRAQAFKYFGRDKLDIGYNPNNLPEHPTTLYNAIFQQVKKRKLTVDPMHTLAALERIEAIDDADYLALLRTYAQGRPGDTEAFLQAALERKHTLHADFERFYRDVLGDKSFSFDELIAAQAKKASTVLPKHLEVSVGDVLEKESWQGIAIPFDTDMVEDVQLHLFTERVSGRRCKIDTRTVYRLKLRPDKQQRVMDIVEAVRKGGSVTPTPGSTLMEDTYYARILEGVRTVNVHLQRGDRKFNPSRLNPALACEAELRALLTSERIEVRDMAEHYLKSIDELTVYLRGGSTPTGHVSQLEAFKVLPGRISPIKAQAAPAFRVTEGIVQLDQRTCVDGHIELKGTEKRVGQLFKGNLPKTGKQYTLEYDDGTKIRLRPFSTDSYDEHAIQLGQNYYAISGDVEILVPGRGTHEQIEQTFEKLRQLGLPAEVAPPEYQEYLYLHQVAVANKLNMTDAGYQQMMRQLEQRNAPIAERVEKLVAYWNGRLGVEDVRKLPRYNPAGVYQLDAQHRRAGGVIGYRRTERFDLDIGKEMRGYNLMHQIVGGGADSYVSMVDLALTHNGSLLSTTEKLRIGVQPGGMSPEADMASGGANYVFTRWRPDPRGAKSKREMGFYLKPGVAQRTDIIVYETDHYGRCYGDFVDRHRTIYPAQWKRIAENSRNNETIIKHNITLLDNLDCIVLDSQEAKRRMIEIFRTHGVTKLPDGRTVEAVIHVIPGAKRGYTG